MGGNLIFFFNAIPKLLADSEKKGAESRAEYLCPHETASPWRSHSRELAALYAGVNPSALPLQRLLQGGCLFSSFICFINNYIERKDTQAESQFTYYPWCIVCKVRFIAPRDRMEIASNLIILIPLHQFHIDSFST